MMGARLNVMAGDFYGKLMIVREEAPVAGYVRRFLCLCECGNRQIVRLAHLRHAGKRCCGCTTGSMYHGLKDHPMYWTWVNMKQRCLNPRCPDYYLYGGRGIDIDPDWVSNFPAFLRGIAELGPKPSPEYQLDRMDNDQGYYAGNLRWATPEEQCSNTRVARVWNVHGKQFQSSDSAGLHFGVSGTTILRWCRGRNDKGYKRPPKPGCSYQMVYVYPEGTERADGYDFMEGL